MSDARKSGPCISNQTNTLDKTKHNNSGLTRCPKNGIAAPAALSTQAAPVLDLPSTPPNTELTMPRENQPGVRIANHILPTAATMTGVCVTIISIVRLTETRHHISTVIDNLLAVNSLFFLISCFLSYLSMRPLPSAAKLEKYADIFFLIGLFLMVIGGFLLAWEFERL